MEPSYQWPESWIQGGGVQWGGHGAESHLEVKTTPWSEYVQKQKMTEEKMKQMGR